MDLKSDSTKLPIFDGTDFPLFMFMLEQALQSKSIQYLLKVLPPVPGADSEHPITKEKITFKTWYNDDQKAQYILTSALSKVDQRRIMAIPAADKSLFKMIDTLHEVYNKSSAMKKVTVYSTMFTYKMKETDTMREHIDNFSRLVQEFVAAGGSASDDALPAALFVSLPSSWESTASTFITSLNATNGKLTLQNLSDALINEDLQRKARKDNPSPSSSSQAFYSKSPVTCFNCGGKGHVLKDCPSPPSDQQQERQGGRDKGKQPPNQSSQRGSFGGNQRGISPYFVRGGNGNVVRTNVSDYVDDSTISSLDGAVVAFIARQRGTWGDSHMWCIDSGASTHMVSRLDTFVEYTPFPTKVPIKVANGGYIFALGHGTVDLRVKRVKGKTDSFRLKDVWYVPDVSHNLLSVGALTLGGYEVLFREGTCSIVKDGVVRATAVLDGGTFYVGTIVGTANSAQAHSSFADPTLWHQRLGHCSQRRLHLWSKEDLATGIGKMHSSVLPQCEACAIGKAQRKSISKNPATRATVPFERVHSDICGPMRTDSIGGCRYFITFIDDCTRYCWVYFLKKKSDAARTFQQWEAYVSTQYNAKVQILRSDNGGEYVGSEFQHILQAKGIKHETTAAHTPEHNGVAERKNRTLVESARCMLLHAGLGGSFWAESVFYANEIANAGPTKALKGKTPFEMLNGKKPSLKRFRVFGCRALALVQDGSPGKFDAKTREMVYLGPGKDSSGYRLWNPITKKMVSNRNVQFFEYMAPKVSRPVMTFLDNNPFLVPAGEVAPSLLEQDGIVAPTRQVIVTPESSLQLGSAPNISTTTTVAVVPPPAPPPPRTGWKGTDSINRFITSTAAQSTNDSVRRSARIEEKRTASTGWGRYRGDEWVANVALTPACDQPLSHTSVAHYSKTACPVNDIDALVVEDTKVTTPLLHWHEGQDHRYTLITPLSETASCSLASANLQAPTVPPDSKPPMLPPRKIKEPTTYAEAMASPEAPQWRIAMERELESLKDQQTWDLVELPDGRHVIGTKWVFKVKFLGDGSVERFKARLVARGFLQRKGVDYEMTYAPVARMTSMRVLVAVAAHEGLTIAQVDVNSAYLHGFMDTEVFIAQPPGFIDPRLKNLVCRLRKSLYGLKQSGRIWNDTAHAAILAMGFVRASADHCIYIRYTAHGKCILGLHVDDFLVVGRIAAIREFIDEFSAKFPVKVMESAEFVVGLQILQHGGEISLSQSTYVSKIVAEMAPNDEATSHQPISSDETKAIVEATVQGQVHPPVNSTEYKSILGSINYAMVSTRPDLAFAMSFLGRYAANPNELHMKAVHKLLRYLRTFPDVSLTYRKGSGTCTFYGYVDADWGGSHDRKSTGAYVFYIGGTPISWQSKGQPTVSLSSTEAEYMATREAAKEIIWLRRLLNDLGHPQREPTVIYEDNTATKSLAENPVHHERTKHIDIAYHFIRERVQTREIRVEHVSTNEQLADLLTKGLIREKWTQMIRKLGLIFNSI